MKTLSKLLFALGFTVFGITAVNAQTALTTDRNKKASEVKRLVNNKDYVFEATQSDMKKGDMSLKYHKYDVALDKDTLVANLPGKNGPVKFDCTNYTYNSWRGKNGSWNVVIKPQSNMTDIRQIRMDIS